jgi:peptidoglycan/LPS O-acetylase OafA/YrhL
MLRDFQCGWGASLIWAPLILFAASLRFGLSNWPPLVFLGRISFSPYLLHVPVAAALGATDKCFLDGAGAMSAMFILVEEPARRYITRRWTLGAAQSLVE